jgi:hypothetical protein
MNPLLLGTASAFGLAASAGLNTTLPLLVVGLLGRFGLLSLTSPFDALSGDFTLGALGVLALLEVAGDKIPGVDSVVQTLQWPMAAAAGAILFASQVSVIQSVSPELAIIVGLFTAGAVHGVRTSARPLVTASTFGVGNPVVSAIEDGVAVVLAVLAVFVPWLSVVLLLGLVVAGVLAARWAGSHRLRLPRRQGLRPSP